MNRIYYYLLFCIKRAVLKMFVFDHESYKGTPAYAAATAMPVILENGRKVFGPPTSYVGPRPSYVCELFVTRIPQQLDELGFLVWLHRLGAVYEFRLMMDTGNSTRGYAFIRFTCESEAIAAYELLKFLFLTDDRLGVFRSQGKNRLFISSIPRHMTLEFLEEGFRQAFPEMQSCVVCPANKPSKAKHNGADRNRGFAFIEFYDHEKALEAKKRLTPGRIRMWGTDLKVQWAKPKETSQVATDSKVLNGKLYSKASHQHNMNDYCAKLRLYCLANNWCIPIIVYGRNFRAHDLQYGGILLKNSFTGVFSTIIMEVTVTRICDIHLLMCEVAVKLVERYAGVPKHHCIVRVHNETLAEIIQTFRSYEDMNCTLLKRSISSIIAVAELAASLQILAQYNAEILLTLYKKSFLTREAKAKLSLDSERLEAQFYALLPKYRNNTKLNNNFNDMEITLLHCLTEKHIEEESLGRNNGVVRGRKCAEYFTLKSQRGYGIKYVLRYVDSKSVELRECYHVTQRINSNPIWIAGHSFQQSIYN